MDQVHKPQHGLFKIKLLSSINFIFRNIIFHLIRSTDFFKENNIYYIIMRTFGISSSIAQSVIYNINKRIEITDSKVQRLVKGAAIDSR